MDAAGPYFQDECDAIRRGEPTKTKVEIDVFNDAFRDAAAEALQRNNDVTSIDLSFRVFLMPQQPFPEPQQRLLPEDDHFLHYLRRSKALRRVGFISGSYHWYDNHFASQLARAVADNPQIECIDVENSMMYLLSVDDCIYMLAKKAKTLKELIFCDPNPEPTEESQRSIANAIAGLRVLEKLCFNAHHGDDRLAELILDLLPRSSCLRELDINTGEVVASQAIAALSRFMGSTQSLEKLVVGNGVYWNGTEMMDTLIQGLEACSTLVVLDISFPFHDGAIQLFTNFVLKERCQAESKLRELCLRCHRNRDFELGGWLRRVLPTPQVALPSSRTTIASSLRFLEINRDTVFAEYSLWQWLSTNVTLQSVHVLSVERVEDLHRFLPAVTHLRELTIGYPGQLEQGNDLVHSMRRNGSLYKLQVHTFYDQVRLSHQQQRLVDAYCQRNQFTDSILLDHIASGALKTGPNPSDTATRLGPCLFRAIQPVQCQAPNTMLMGLLAYDDSSIGPDGNCMKRSVC